MNRLRALWLLIAVLAGPPAVAADFVLEGDLSAIYRSGNFVVWAPKPSPGGKQAGGMMAAATSGQDKPAGLESTLDVITKAPLSPDGTFRVEATVETPTVVHFYVLDAIGHEGQRYAPYKGNAFILEPGNLRLHMSRPGQFFIEGAERQRFAVGAGIRDFTAQTLDGKSIRLADVRANSKLVLVEFWASWCGPCRVEIPHMKEAYSRYRDRGFEIVSFTIDNDREDWEVASEEEELPWHDLGMGEDADAPRAYNVTGVPKNYLVDSASGEILAKDLCGHHLDEKLAELLGAAARGASSQAGMVQP